MSRLSRLTGLTAAALVLAGLLVLIPSRNAAFLSVADNVSNSWAADTVNPPTSLAAVANAADVDLDWTATPDSYAAGHRIYRSTTSGGPYVQIAQTTPRTTTTYVDTPVDGTYYYVARAYYLNWESADSNEATATFVTPEDYDAVVPASDNCPTTFNIDQYDTDADGTGDACDATPTLSSAGAFTNSGQSLGSGDSKGVAFGDVDGDGDLDAIIANDGNNTVWVNSGTGTFSNSGQSLGSKPNTSVALGDLDGDGDLDVFFATDGGILSGDANTVWINNGSGTFTDSGQSLGSGDSEGVGLGDLDGDGDLDAIIANDGNNTVWVNNGSGTFTNSGQSLGSADSRDVALGDLDGDGDLDAFFATNGGFLSSDANTVWVNNGSGTFTNSGQSLGSGDSRGVALGDSDGDGDLDAIIANDGSNIVWLNN